MIAPTSGQHALRADPDELDLDLDALHHLGNKVFRVVCSEPWQRHCVGLILHGDVAYKPAVGEGQEKELRRKGVYPPGGLLTGMIRCKGRCGKYVPPQTVGQDRQCLDCHYEGMSLFEWVRLPSSPGSTTRVPDGDAYQEFGVWKNRRGEFVPNCTTKKLKRIEKPEDRLRYLHDDGGGFYSVREPFTGEDGFKYEAVFEVVTVLVPAPEAAAEAGKGA